MLGARELKDREKINRTDLSLQHLLQYADEGEDMLNRTVTGDESWVHYYQPKSKSASVQWKHPNSPTTKKFKVMLIVFWDSQGVLLAHFQKYGENVNSESYCEVLFKLWDAIHRKCPSQLARGVLLQYGNARNHTAQTTQKRIQELQWELLEHPPYSLDLVPSEYHPFGPLSTTFGGKRFADDEEVETEVWKWLRQQSKDLYTAGFDALVK
jgi:histone-lysine N-methyltransferase SETMAR